MSWSAARSPSGSRCQTGEGRLSLPRLLAHLVRVAVIAVSQGYARHQEIFRRRQDITKKLEGQGGYYLNLGRLFQHRAECREDEEEYSDVRFGEYLVSLVEEGGQRPLNGESEHIEGLGVDGEHGNQFNKTREPGIQNKGTRGILSGLWSEYR